MNCVNIKHPNYIKLEKEALSQGRDLVNFKLDMDLFNTENLSLPNSLEELDKGIERFEYRSYMHDKIVNIAKLNSPSFSNDKPNIFEIRVVESSDKIKTYEQTVEVAKKIVDKINKEFNFEGQNNLARLSTSSGVTKVIIEPTNKIIDAFITREKESDLNDLLDYEASITPEEDFSNLLDIPESKGGITQFCSR